MPRIIDIEPEEIHKDEASYKMHDGLGAIIDTGNTVKDNATTILIGLIALVVIRMLED